MAKIKILLAEDEANLGMIVKESLESRDFEVFLAENGEIAFEIYQKKNPDVLVLDVMMPKKDGFTLAKEILKHHSWASMAKFTRGGGEANAVAIRIARSNTERKNVAFCGYHGWHDWYLSSNLNSKKNLDQHLMSGLNYDGMHENLKNTSFPFPYNDFKYLLKLIGTTVFGL